MQSKRNKTPYIAFLDLDEEVQKSACEMDTVVDMRGDKKCLLTLYLRPCKFQLALVLNDKTVEAVADAFDNRGHLLGSEYFSELFGYVLTDNGSEFSDHTLLEKSVLDRHHKRLKLFFCDIRQSQQKDTCEMR